MRRVIVDYAKLTNEILNLLVEKFPDGYDDSNIIRFKNHKDTPILYIKKLCIIILFIKIYVCFKKSKKKRVTHTIF